MFKGLKLFFKEFSEVSRFQDPKNDKTLVIYSEGAMFYQYFDEIIDYVLKNSELEINYLTSDFDDPVFKKTDKRLKTFYIKNTLNSVIAKLDKSLLVMTMTDLGQFYIKRSQNNVNHVYVFHALVSTHFTYRLGAFDNYDTIFCVGSHHVKEIKKTEEIYKLPAKKLIESGYSRIEKIYNNHQEYLKTAKNENKVNILIAPTWGEGNIVETCVKELATTLATDTKNHIVIRPHPETKKRNPAIMKQLTGYFKKYENINLELDLTSQVSIHNADILITDWSGIAYEYAFGTERPVLFINTARKLENNAEWEKLQIEPIDISLRNKIGKAVELSEISTISEIVSDFLKSRDKYKKEIVKSREECMFNWMKSSEVSGKYIIDLCKEMIK